MHIGVIFHNIGGYHAARLQATEQVFQQAGWSLTAIQVTDQTREHPWGDLEQSRSFPIKTLLSPAHSWDEADRRPESRVAVSSLVQYLDSLKPDVLVIPGWGFPISRTALRWAKQHRIPAILMSESKRDDELRVWWKERLKSWLYVKQFDAALVGGKRHQDYLVELGFPRDRIFLGYDAVDNDHFAKTAAIARLDPAAARQRQPAIPSRPYWLATTRFIPRKNIPRLVEAFAHYRQQVGAAPAWDLVICGSGVEAATIQQTIQHHRLQDCVHLPGFIPYNQIGDWYGLAQAFIHPALQEQWGLVVNEACAAGLPILCSATVGASELVKAGHNGVLFNPANAADITRALLALHNLDAEQRSQMGHQSQAIVQQYGPDYFAAGLLQAIHSCPV
jgi:1,2-diacylglycerol 3-alpha-glucosyltransferase